MTGDQAVHAWLSREGAHRDFVAWAEPFGPEVVRLWESCPRGDWLLALAARLRAPSRLLVMAACDCALGALEALGGQQERVFESMSTIRRWAAGTLPPLSTEQIEGMRAQLEAARDGAQDAAEAEAALAALAALETIGDPAMATSAAAFAAHASLMSAADCAMEQALRFAQHQSAQAVRAVLPAVMIAGLWGARESKTPAG